MAKVAKRIACVVEGHGDVEAVPILIERIAQRFVPATVVQVSVPVRTPKSKLVKEGELERAVEFAARRAGPGAVLVILDSDDDCPAQVGPSLLARAGSVRVDLPVAVVLAKREFESWFVAGAASIGGHAGLPTGLQPPADPEAIRGAKEWLTQRMAGSRSYSPTLDQRLLAQRVSLDEALSTGSFAKLRRDIQRLIQQAPNAW